jgi:hypothetical protein
MNGRIQDADGWDDDRGLLIVRGNGWFRLCSSQAQRAGRSSAA